ncbi:unnamed protein product, partial [Meganyctiphanes norvegica]
MDFETLRSNSFFRGHRGGFKIPHIGFLIITSGKNAKTRPLKILKNEGGETNIYPKSIVNFDFRCSRQMVPGLSNTVCALAIEQDLPDKICFKLAIPDSHINTHSGQISLTDLKKQLVILEPKSKKNEVAYRAQILSHAVRPCELLASSSCDGSVRVWDITSSKVNKSWDLLKKCNDVSSSDTLCRLSWMANGKFLAVPVEKEVQIYERGSWNLKFTFKDENIKETVSIVSISECGKFVACACKDGTVVVWDANNHKAILVEKHPKGKTISGLAWNPKLGKKELAFVDIDGQFGTIENIIASNYKSVPVILGGDTGVDSSSTFPPMDVDMDDDDADISISKMKAQLGFADDEEGTFLGLPEDSELFGGDGGQSEKGRDTPSIAAGAESAPAAPVMKLPEIQKPFQPGMSPEHHSDRYMVWNNVGVVKQYSSEDENSVDVEFHDTAVHHGLHLNNNLGHSMADLSQQALALAAEAHEDQPSKLVVHHFSALGGSKEWSVDMANGEEILALCLGTNFVAVATDRRNLRIFSTGGVQRDVISIPGPIVCCIGHEDMLMVTFHTGMGASGDQQIGCLVLNLAGGRHPVPVSTPLPLSPHAFLAWAGFSDEGTPVIMDSAGILRMMHFKMGYNWTVVLNTKTHVRRKSDHHFVLGLNEKQGVVRSVLCKGSRYPSVLPRPHITLLSMQIPICELETEKGGLEEKIIRSRLLMNTLERLGKTGYDVEEAETEADKILKEAMIKLFALACRTERESRALEICQLMPSHQTVQLCIKYAGKQRRIQLAEKLGELASQKMDEEYEKQAAKEREEGLELYSGSGIRRMQWNDGEEEEDEEDSQTQHTQEEESSTSDNPLLSAVQRRENTPKGSHLLASQDRKNPFKKSSTPGSGARGINVIDQYRKAQKKAAAESSPSLKPIMRKAQNKQSSLKKNLSSPKSADKENKAVNSSTAAPVKKQSALQLWLADNKEEVRTKFPDAAEYELVGKAALLFKDLDEAVKQKYKKMIFQQTLRVLSNDNSEEEKKRKRDDNVEDSPAEKKTKGSGVSKLAAFAFNKDS